MFLLPCQERCTWPLCQRFAYALLSATLVDLWIRDNLVLPGRPVGYSIGRIYMLDGCRGWRHVLWAYIDPLVVDQTQMHRLDAGFFPQGLVFGIIIGQSIRRARSNPILQSC